MRTTFYTLIIICFGLFGSSDVQAQAPTDCPPLTPFCQDLNTSYMPGACMVEVWAKDFISKINDGSEPLDSFWISFDPNELVMNLTFFSEDESPQVVKIYIKDKDGCASTICEVELDINDNEGTCSQGCVDSEYTGFAVATCTAELNGNGSVAVIYDVRNNQTEAPKGEDWSSLDEINPPNWQIDSLGQIFGIALDEFDNIYFSASDVYKTDYDPVNGFTRGQIFKSSPPSFRAEPFASLPNFGGELNGLGNLAYNHKNNLLYASNLEDGKIYRIDLNGNILDSFDPFEKDNNSEGIVEISEQIWGIQFNQEGDDCKLYFARIEPGVGRSMYSTKLLIDGSFSSLNPVVREISNLPGVRSRITDIAFSKGGDIMLTAERGTNFIPNTGQRGPHEAQVNKYVRNGTSWLAIPKKIHVGERLNGSYEPGENSAGGVDFGYEEQDGDPLALCDSLIWATANFMRLPKTIPGTSSRFILYGMEGIRTSGNKPFNAGDTTSNVYCDLFKDFDGDYVDPNQNLGLDLDDKARIGDVEVFRCSPKQVSGTQASAIISGSVESVYGQMLDQVEIGLKSGNMSLKTMSQNGYYAFKDLSKYDSYEVKASFSSGDPLDGVTTRDLIMIQRYILGLGDFENPLSILAADIDRSNHVSSKDLLNLRKLLLGKEKDFVKGESWVTSPKIILGDSQSMFDMPSSLELPNLIENEMSSDFIAVKLGDVDGSNSIDQQAAPRSFKRKTANWFESPEGMSKKQTIEIPNTKNHLGFFLSLKGLGLSPNEGVSSNLHNFNESNYYFDGDVLRIVYNEKINSESIILKFSLGNVSLNQLEITGLVYSSTLEESHLDFRTAVFNTTPIFSPNPFENSTDLDLDLALDGDLTIDVFNINGTHMSSMVRRVKKGRNILTLKSEELNISEGGIYIARINTGTSTYSVKLITQ